jgi:redox-sensitive bicupin YhaK (pirin superfamily)
MIYPGEVNWMIAGPRRGPFRAHKRGHARSRAASLAFKPGWRSRTTPRKRRHSSSTTGKMPFPCSKERAGLRFDPGTAWGARAPVKTFTEMFYADVVLEPGAALPLPDNHEDRGLYITQGAIEVAGDRFESGRMMVFRPGDAISVRAGEQGAADVARRRDPKWPTLHPVE